MQLHLLGDFVDLKCVDEAQGAGACPLYVRTMLLADRLMKDDMVRRFLGGLGSRMVFYTEYMFRRAVSGQGLTQMSL